ncbi:MAG: hypothetical protein HN542_03095 [Flavobacteriales bacterium]|jgi:pyrimidine operon attenuation protein / uracil phosphoribosyltransferase|nr:hypothetical protein [Flavobacteriales bacterium]NCG29396.1 hypothetical protein [Bacteroidota bacterium]MBT3964214.1 hypothetical protein [Flavobacteriales bacterium]MBT4704153.1 hypothetical protein [Flavobacteriales bacterium]MBT4930027.1 hypothetical protein [Flavobacteriales bacterium]
MKTVVLNPANIERILRRISYQIVESTEGDLEITLIGMMPRGAWVADQLVSHLSEISKVRVKRLDVDADDVETLSAESSAVKDKEVVLVDDIINSGVSMMRVAGAIMQFEPRCLITVSLVDRKHRKFPIKSDFTGLSLATTMQEHLRLEIKPKPTIYLQ